MSGENKYFRTVVTYEVLTEYQAFNGDADELADAITTGDASGTVLSRTVEEISPAVAARLLIAQGSEPGFFMLNDDGTPASD